MRRTRRSPRCRGTGPGCRIARCSCTRPRTAAAHTAAAAGCATGYDRWTPRRTTSGSSWARGRSERRRDDTTVTRHHRRTEIGASIPQELAVVDRETAVHHDGYASALGPRPRRLVRDAELQPHEFGTDRDCLVHHRPRELAAPEHVHDVDGVVPRRVRQRPVAALPEDFVVPGVHRHDAVAGPLQVARDAVT